MWKFAIKINLKTLPSISYTYKSSPFQMDSMKFFKCLVKMCWSNKDVPLSYIPISDVISCMHKQVCRIHIKRAKKKEKREREKRKRARTLISRWFLELPWGTLVIQTKCNYTARIKIGESCTKSSKFIEYRYGWSD